MRQVSDAVVEEGRALGRRPLLDHGQLGVGFQAGDDAAAGPVQLGPPAEVVIAHVEDVGGSRLDRHGLGGGDVIDLGGGHFEIDRRIGVGVVDDVGLGPVNAVGEAGPVAGRARQPDAGGVDQTNRVGRMAGEPPAG